MFKHSKKLLQTDCVVVSVNDHTVYPIFRVGSTSLFDSADKKFTNKEISQLENITVLLRDPEERFVSGLNKYCWQHALDVDAVWNQVAKGNLIDRHFAPQYIWLVHLGVFYKGKVSLRPFSEIDQITDQHFISVKDRNRKKQQVPAPKSFVNVDKRLFKYLNKEIVLPDLLKEFKDGLS
jgi:hypothetical protein